VVLREDVPGLGSVGTLTNVPNGYFRNFLKPQNLAAVATEGLLECGSFLTACTRLHAACAFT
jgi:large subunit ribosomal protein L9